jgi:archaellum component FlaC
MEALKVSRQMDNWNDDRLDELARGMNDRFDKVDARFEKVEGEMKEGFAAVDERFDKVDERFDKVDERFDKVDRTSSAIRERLARIETKLEGLARLERLVWGFGSALLIAVVGPRFF